MFSKFTVVVIYLIVDVGGKSFQRNKGMNFVSRVDQGYASMMVFFLLYIFQQLVVEPLAVCLALSSLLLS